MVQHAVPIKKLSLDYFVRASQIKSRLRLSRAASRQIAHAVRIIEHSINKGRVIYGVNTGVGDLCDKIVPLKELSQLQENLILSHACGLSPYFEERISRGALFLLINSRVKGFSGVREETLQKLITLFNKGVSPLMPTRGSLGASGDLIPLAHLALILLGKGMVYEKGSLRRASSILKHLRFKRHVFSPKEALSLINGTEATTSSAAFILHDAQKLFYSGLRASAALFEVLGSSRGALDSRLHNLKPHQGQKEVARLLRKFLQGSKLCDRPRQKVQDSYVVRCAPQIEGSVWDTLENVKKAVEIEMNSVTDNPLFFGKSGRGIVVSGGNFHAQNLAFSLDFLGVSLAVLGKLMEGRIERMLNPSLNGGLPPFLVKECGLNSGLMILQYLAAALVAENAVLSHPASIQSLPVSAHQEDFVSMAMTSANKTYQILQNCEKILAVETMVLVEAMDMVKSKLGFPVVSFSTSARAFYEKIRSVFTPLKKDRWLSRDLESVLCLLQDGKLLDTPIKT